VTPADLRLAALAAVFARDRASELLARWAEPHVAERARELAAVSRRERLAALSTALAAGLARADGAAALDDLRREHPRVADALRSPSGVPLRPGLARLLRERLDGALRQGTARSGVRVPDAAPDRPAWNPTSSRGRAVAFPVKRRRA
jgi:hypothetical protein